MGNIYSLYELQTSHTELLLIRETEMERFYEVQFLPGGKKKRWTNWTELYYSQYYPHGILLLNLCEYKEFITQIYVTTRCDPFNHGHLTTTSVHIGMGTCFS